MQMAVLSLLVLVPLIYTEQLSQVLNRGTLFAPSVPPAPPPPRPAVAQTVQPQTRATRTMQALSILPIRLLKPLSKIADDVFNEAPAQVCANCVVGGTSSPLISGNGYIGDGSRVVPPPPPAVPLPGAKPEPPKVIRVGGDVLAANLLRRVVPVYPPLAKQARVSGTVRLEGTISSNGTIENLRVISGHPLLVRAALEAVQQWVYRPTLLNGIPVAVTAPIDVIFTLSN